MNVDRVGRTTLMDKIKRKEIRCRNGEKQKQTKVFNFSKERNFHEREGRWRGKGK